MKIGTVRRILKEDLAKDGEKLPGWLGPLLDPLNTFIGLVVSALTNRLTLQDNFAGKLVRISLKHDTPLAISPAPLRSRITGLIPLSFEGEELDAYSWEYTDDGQIEVKFSFVSATTEEVEAVFFLLAE